MLGSTDQELPKYVSHKALEAIKIASMEYHPDGTATLTPEDEDVWSFQVSQDFLVEYSPSIGGYYVKDSEGEEFFLDEDDFENEYAKVFSYTIIVDCEDECDCDCGGCDE